MKVFYFCVNGIEPNDCIYQYELERVPCIGEKVSIAEYALDSANSEAYSYKEYIVTNVKTVIEINHGNEGRTNHLYKDKDVKFYITLKVV